MLRNNNVFYAILRVKVKKIKKMLREPKAGTSFRGGKRKRKWGDRRDNSDIICLDIR